MWLQYVNASNERKLHESETQMFIKLAKESSANYNCWTKVNQLLNTIVSERSERYKQQYIFFCSTTSSGTEGIRGVKNFVALLAPYRGFFATVRQADPFIENKCVLIEN